MRLDIDITEDGKRIVTVVLSRRNLLCLLGKLELEWSARTITSRNCFQDGELTPLTPEEAKNSPVLPTMLVARSESDEQHYAARPFPPGDMHPATEQFVRRHGGWSRTEG